MNNLPKLRFPEFWDAGEWEEKKLGEIAALITEKTGNKKYTLMSINAGVGLVSQIEKFGREIAGNSYKNYFVIRENDFAYNKSATKDYPEGFIAMHSSMELAAVPNSIFTCFRTQENKVYPQYLNYLFLCNLHGKWLKQFISVGARAHGSLNIDNKYLLLLPIPLPKGESSLSEQQKIADCLSSIDDRITLETKKLDTLKAHKKGLMQQLFPAEGETIPKLRFPEFHDSGEWEEKKLEDISSFINQKVPLEQVSLLNYISTENLLPDYAGVTTASKLPPLGNATQFLKNDVLISNIRPYLKKVWFADKDGAASNDVIVIRAKASVINEYLAFLLKNDKFIDYVMEGAKGVKMPRGDISLMRQYPLAIPSLTEQQKIADCLSSIDEAIAAQIQAISTLKTHKKGLMQQLFPSVDEVTG
jgi:type I restriction enzyme S subunit